MVIVYSNKENEEVTFGELLQENKYSFRLHSSSVIYNKEFYYYERVV